LIPIPTASALQALLDSRLDLLHLLRHRFAMRRISGRQPRAGILHHFHPHGNMADTHSEIDQRLSIPLRVPFVNVRSPCLQLQRRRHSIARLEFIIAGLLSMFMQINESRRHRQPAGFDRFSPA
jgi:lipopolysaccharide export LptBFGC system permease protein LptF